MLHLSLAGHTIVLTRESYNLIQGELTGLGYTPRPAIGGNHFDLVAGGQWIGSSLTHVGTTVYCNLSENGGIIEGADERARPHAKKDTEGGGCTRLYVENLQMQAQLEMGEDGDSFNSSLLRLAKLAVDEGFRTPGTISAMPVDGGPHDPHGDPRAVYGYQSRRAKKIVTLRPFSHALTFSHRLSY